jgi:hypothetical protein
MIDSAESTVHKFNLKEDLSMTLTEALYKGWRTSKLAYRQLYDLRDGSRCLLGMIRYGATGSDTDYNRTSIFQHWMTDRVALPCGCLTDNFLCIKGGQSYVATVLAHMSNEHLYKKDPAWPFERIAQWFEEIEKQHLQSQTPQPIETTKATEPSEAADPVAAESLL